MGAKPWHDRWLSRAYCTQYVLPPMILIMRKIGELCGYESFCARLFCQLYLSNLYDPFTRLFGALCGFFVRNAIQS